MGQKLCRLSALPAYLRMQWSCAVLCAREREQTPISIVSHALRLSLRSPDRTIKPLSPPYSCRPLLLPAPPAPSHIRPVGRIQAVEGTNTAPRRPRIVCDYPDYPGAKAEGVRVRSGQRAKKVRPPPPLPRLSPFSNSKKMIS